MHRVLESEKPIPGTCRISLIMLKGDRCLDINKCQLNMYEILVRYCVQKPE